jgi:hypothetical protein
MCSEGRKPCSELAWCCLILLDFCYGWRAWRGQNLVWNWLDFALILLLDCYCSVLLSYRILIVVPGYRICCLVMVSYGGVAYCIGYCIGCLGMVGDRFSLSLSCVALGENLVRTWLDFAWFCVFCAMVDGCGEGRKARSDLLLLCLIFVVWWRGVAWCRGFYCYCDGVVFRSPWWLYWLSWYGLVVLLS